MAYPKRLFRGYCASRRQDCPINGIFPKFATNHSKLTEIRMPTASQIKNMRYEQVKIKSFQRKGAENAKVRKENL